MTFTKKSVINTIKSGGSFPLILVIGLAIASLWSLNSVHDSLELVNHTNRVTSTADHILDRIVDCETGMRGFLVTGADDFMDPYVSGKTDIDKLVRDLRRSVADNPSQVTHLDSMHRDIKTWFTEVAEPYIAIRREVNRGNNALKQFQEISARTVGKVIFDELRDTISAVYVRCDKASGSARIVQKLLIDILNQETGQRGFLLTGKESSLQPYQNSRIAFREHLEELQSFLRTGRSSGLTNADANNIERLVVAWHEKAADPEIEARRKMNEVTATMDDIIHTMELGLGKKHMDGIRARAAEFTTIEKTLLKQREERAATTATITNIVVSVGSIILAIALVLMTLKLKASTAAAEEQLWQATSQAGLSEKIRGEQNVGALAQNVVDYLTPQLNAQLGALYIIEQDKLSLVASHAYNIRKSLAHEFVLGQGIVGQVAREKSHIMISDVPEDYVRITSGLGNAAPRNIVAFPLIYNDEIKGVVEVGSLNEFTDAHITMVKRVAETVAVAIHTAQARERMSQLLEETQVQSEELQAGQEELRQTNEELEEQTEALRTNEARLQGQQEELRQANEELEQGSNALKEESDKVNQRNDQLEEVRRQVLQKASDLEQASKYKSEFLANMSHELRTPLNSLLILSNLLADNKDGNLTEKETEFARTINTSGHELLALINDILDLSKVEAGKLEVTPENIALDELTEYVHQTFVHQTEEKGLELNLSVADNLPKSITSDRRRLEQMLKNLVANAIKFTSDGSVSVTISRPKAGSDLSKGHLTPDNSVAIAVSDSGIGIPVEKRNLIFEAFSQADGSTSRQFGGTGLGLSICKNFAARLGGDISMTSEVGDGSTFTIYLPEEYSESDKVHSILADLAAYENEESQEQNANGAETPSKRRKTKEGGGNSILIIEGDEQLSEILARVSTEKGFEPTVAKTGEAGLKQAEECPPKAIILDIGLPDMDGLTVLTRLKENPVTRHIPVQVLSERNHAIQARKLGAVGFLEKPVGMEQLDTALNSISDELSGRQKRILIVEDEEVQQNILKQHFANSEIQPTIAATAEEAIRLLAEQRFDLVILDLCLPDMNGLELLEKLDNEKLIQNTPVIVNTSTDLTRSQEQQLRGFAESIVIKDVKSPERLLEETKLFLHKVECGLPAEQRPQVKMFQDKEGVLRDKTILTIDDDIRNLFALTSVLEKYEINVVSARTGIEGIQKLQEAPQIDLVLMDIMMPEMDGYEAMRKIRKMDTYHDLPIIALTAKAMRGDRAKCIEAGASDYLAKPVDAERLMSLLRVWLHRTQMEQPETVSIST